MTILKFSNLDCLTKNKVIWTEGNPKLWISFRQFPLRPNMPDSTHNTFSKFWHNEKIDLIAHIGDFHTWKFSTPGSRSKNFETSDLKGLEYRIGNFYFHKIFKIFIGNSNLGGLTMAPFFRLFFPPDGSSKKPKFLSSDYIIRRINLRLMTKIEWKYGFSNINHDYNIIIL